MERMGKVRRASLIREAAPYFLIFDYVYSSSDSTFFTNPLAPFCLLCYNIPRWQTDVRKGKTNKNNCISQTDKQSKYICCRQKGTGQPFEVNMESTGYFVVKQRALPEVLLKVVEAKRMLESEKVHSVQEAVDKVGISRSSFYKYKEDIFPFHDTTEGKTVTMTVQMDDQPGLLSDVLKIIAAFGANILTIHQSIPINGVASLSVSVQVLSTTRDMSEMIDRVERKEGVHYVKILAKE